MDASKSINACVENTQNFLFTHSNSMLFSQHASKRGKVRLFKVNGNIHYFHGG
jgi:hypothetical protein